MIDYLKSEKDFQDNKFKEELLTNEYLGIIIKVDDEESFNGRCKVRVFEKFDELSDGDIPWAFPKSNISFAETIEDGDGGTGVFSYPKLGSLVRVKFQNGDLYSPEYFMVQNINESLMSEIKDSYINCHSLVYDKDEDMKIIYTQNGGLLLWHKGSYMRIDKEKHITIEHLGGTSIQTFINGDILVKSNDSIINKSAKIHLDSENVLLGPNGFESCTRCDSLMNFLTALCTIIDAKVPSAPAASNLLKSFKPMICSTTVKVAK